MFELRLPLAAGLVATLMLLAGCGEEEGGPVVVSAIGNQPKLVDPNRAPLDPPSALLIDATAQGLVRFESTGLIEPALAQRWIVSDDGLRYTFRLARTQWSGSGTSVTADQVARRIRAAMAPASRNSLKPVLGSIEEVVSMTDDVLEISLRSPRATFLDLMAQPEMGIIVRGEGSGPFRASAGPGGAVLLSRAGTDEEENQRQEIILRGERAALAVVRFREGVADFVTGGTAGTLPVVRAARIPAQTLRFDPVSGMFGIAFLHDRGLSGDVEFRKALSMAIDRDALVAALDVPNLQPRISLLPLGLQERPNPTLPNWVTLPFNERRSRAAGTIARLASENPLSLRVAIPDEPGYRVLFSFIRSQWNAIGVQAEAVGAGESADLALVDAVAPASLASWYLRHFTCRASPICSADADESLEGARNAVDPAERREMLANADRVLAEETPFIALTAPVRWHLVSRRLSGFQTNAFGRHPIDRLIAAPRR